MPTSAVNELRERIASARATKSPVRIVGGGSKAAWLRAPDGEALSTAALRGIVDYEPSELVLCAQAGTPLHELQVALDSAGQTLPFEPPAFGADATIGGVVACGWSGPARPWRGAVRDAVLGVRMINGQAQCLHFGGMVMKNVAGYDLARLQVGAFGSLGLLTEVALKVLPRPACEQTQLLQLDRSAAHRCVVALQRTAAPVTATSHAAGRLYVRFAGAEPAVRAAATTLGGECVDAAAAHAHWHGVREHEQPFFAGDAQLLRFSLPHAAPYPELPGEWFTEWAGALRWLRTAINPDVPAPSLISADAVARTLGGSAQRWRPTLAFAPLPTPRAQLQARLSHAFDPDALFAEGVH